MPTSTTFVSCRSDQGGLRRPTGPGEGPLGDGCGDRQGAKRNGLVFGDARARIGEAA